MFINRIMTAGLSVGLAFLAGTTAPTLAADWNYGDGMAKARRGSAAIPVPAPEPVPDYMSGYYIRVDAAYNYSDTDKFVSNWPHVDDMRSDSGLKIFGRYGFGFGYYFSRWFRADVTFDTRNDVRSKASGSIDYSVTDAGYAAGSATFRDTAFDRIRHRNYTGMLNAYFDIPMGHAWTPYVGVGIGATRHRTTRIFSLLQECIDLVDCDTDPLVVAPGTVTTAFVDASGKDTAWGLAASLMAGAAYQFSRSGKIDFGYRWLYQEGVSFNLGGERLSLPDQNIHEVRVGLRYDIN